MNELIESANKPQDRSREFPATLNRMTMEMQHSATKEEDRWTQSYLHFNSLCYLPEYHPKSSGRRSYAVFSPLESGLPSFCK